MTPAAYRLALDAIGWSYVEVAERSGVSERTARRWAAGTADVPEPIAAWLRHVAAWHQAHPAPAKEGQR